MSTYTVHQAKTNLSKLLAEVEAGGEVIIARNDKPVARLVRVEAAVKEPLPDRVFGKYKGLATVGPEFFEDYTDEEIDEWDNEPISPDERIPKQTASELAEPPQPPIVDKKKR